MQIDDIRAFERIAACGTLSEVSRRYGNAKSSLSHQLRRLETELGTTLFERKGSQLVLTEAGETFLEHARDIARACERAEDAARSQRGGAVKLRIGTTDELGTNLMAPMCLSYMRRNRDISLDLLVLNKVDLFHRDAELDCILFAGPPPEEEAKNMIQRRIARYVSRMYAAPDHLAAYGTPHTLDDLRHHPLIENRGAGGSPVWSISNDRERAVIRPEGPVASNDNWVAKLSAIQAVGVGFFPDWFTVDEVRAGLLVPVMPEWHSDVVSISVLYHTHRFSNPHIRALADFLAGRFQGFYHFPYRENDLELFGIQPS
ncbi:DNA-binding transcriptional LysR family regulator [Rhizobium sp. BK313]|uniref:LysR family transcriptional regulator n=1 Tax=Rhizobium sp. BK313 TaxID=2587081 RepID=UPI0010E76B37|nr:LysR family transcriptional regulator [Rhizobium sp. BK313]MBB3458315.1 DNA-binding transcriptional LysR family regulator [Rhizobium sp. BK313]